QIKIIKEAFRLRYRKDSKLVSEYAGYIKNLRNADNQDDIEDLYNLYYELSKKDRPMTKTEIKEAVENVLIDE
ncbi:5583_t:CDS:2, partial [Racocetra persica]